MRLKLVLSMLILSYFTFIQCEEINEDFSLEEDFEEEYARTVERRNCPSCKRDYYFDPEYYDTEGCHTGECFECWIKYFSDQK